jgi:hypothetical protein
MIDNTALQRSVDPAPLGQALDGAPVAAPPIAVAPLPAAAPRLRLGLDQRLWLDRGGQSVRVKPVRCFPWSSPLGLVSLRDDAEREQLLVNDPADLDPSSAEALELALRGPSFVLDVDALEAIEEDYEVRVWRTHTRQGPRTFQTRLDEWPWPSPGGGHLVRDLAGDLIHLPPLEQLDAKSRHLLWPYVA